MLNPNHGSCFAKIGQAAFNPAHFVPGIGPSPDKMLQGRLFLPSERYSTAAGSARLTLRPAGQPPARVRTPASCSRERLDAHRRQAREGMT